MAQALLEHVGVFGRNVNKIFQGTAIPLSSDLGGIAAQLGDIIINSSPTASAPLAWVCTVAGTASSPAGTWQPFGGDGLSLLTADGAIPPHSKANYVITKGSAAALTLAAPTATAEDGIMIKITSSTAFAHAITATGLLQTGSANVNVATFAANAGASLTLMAYQGKWLVVAQNQITFT